MIQKLLITTLSITYGVTIPTYATCPIASLGSCKAEINRTDFQNTNLQDKIIPNRMNTIIQPNTTTDNRTLQGQQQSPRQINRELIQQEDTQPYNANCQFGNCFNKTNSPGNNNN